MKDRKTRKYWNMFINTSNHRWLLFVAAFLCTWRIDMVICFWRSVFADWTKVYYVCALVDAPTNQRMLQTKFGAFWSCVAQRKWSMSTCNISCCNVAVVQRKQKRWVNKKLLWKNPWGSNGCWRPFLRFSEHQGGQTVYLPFLSNTLHVECKEDQIALFFKKIPFNVVK